MSYRKSLAISDDVLGRRGPKWVVLDLTCQHLRALRSQTALDLADAELHVTALRHRLLVLDNVIRDYMLGGKQGVR